MATTWTIGGINDYVNHEVKIASVNVDGVEVGYVTETAAAYVDPAPVDYGSAG